MKLSDVDKNVIKDLYQLQIEAVESGDSEYVKFILRRIDNMPVVLKIKMMADLIEYWETGK